VTALEVEYRYYKPVRETHAVVEVRKQILELNTAGSHLDLLRVERSWQMRMHRNKKNAPKQKECTETKIRIASDYCERRFALLFVVLSFIAGIASRDVQVCLTCLVVLETSTECGLCGDIMKFQTQPSR